MKFDGEAVTCDDAKGRKFKDVRRRKRRRFGNSPTLKFKIFFFFASLYFERQTTNNLLLQSPIYIFICV